MSKSAKIGTTVGVLSGIGDSQELSKSADYLVIPKIKYLNSQTGIFLRLSLWYPFKIPIFKPMSYGTRKKCIRKKSTIKYKLTYRDQLTPG